MVWVVAAALLLMLLGIGLLYAYRAQSPSTPVAAYAKVVSEIQAGQVSKVTINGDTATIEKTDGSRETTNLGSDNGALEKVVLEYNATQPNGRMVALTTQQNSPSIGVAASIILSLLPLVLLAVLMVWLVRAVVRAIDRR